MKHSVIVIMAALALCFGGAAHAAKNDPHSQVAEELRKLSPGLPIDSVSKTDMDGIYEVVSNGDIFYFHLGTRSVILGNIIREGKSLTQERKSQIQALLARSLPLDKAVRIGNGPNTVVEFTDPDCPFCRRADNWLKDRQDISLYLFMYPLPMHRDAAKKSKNILCAAKPGDAYRDTMAGKYDKNFDLPKGCDEKVGAILDEHIKWGRKMGVQGTPAFWVNGQGVSGADMAKVESLLRGSKPQPNTVPSGKK